MKIAVTGATGFIGRYIVQDLLDNRYEVRAWYRTETSRERVGGSFRGVNGEALTWIPGELGAKDSVVELLSGVHAVIHAALFHPGKEFQGGEGEVSKFVERNILGSLQIFEEAKRLGGLPTVFVSTCAVHDRILPDRPLDETHPLWPFSHYGAHKAAIEKFIHAYGYGENLPFCALRPTGVYGVHHQPEKSKWMKLVQDVVRGEPVRCGRGGKEVHAHDVARAARFLLEAGEMSGEAFNCYDRYVSEWDVAHYVKTVTKSLSVIEGEEKRPKHEISTEKLQSRAFRFGGEELFKKTIRDLIQFCSSE